MVTEKTYKGDVDINYAKGPEQGQPLLLLHGTTNRWQAFQRHIPSFTDRCHVYTTDYRGHGKSGRGKHYGYGFFYRDTEQFIEEVISEPAVIFGHSLGGRLALKLAAERPDLVTAVILGDSRLSDPQPSTRMAEVFGRYLPLLEIDNSVESIYNALKNRAGDDFDPDFALERAKNMSYVDPKFIKYLVDYGGDLDSPYGHSTGFRPSEHLKKVKCPVLILQAEKGMLSDEVVENAMKILPEKYWVKLKDMPHEFLYRDIVPVVEAVNEFLDMVL